MVSNDYSFAKDVSENTNFMLPPKKPLNRPTKHITYESMLRGKKPSTRQTDSQKLTKESIKAFPDISVQEKVQKQQTTILRDIKKYGKDQMSMER